MHPAVALLLAALTGLAATAAPASGAAADGTPVRGGRLQLATASDWRSLDPAIGFDIGSMVLQRILFRSLLDYDAGNNLVPDGARDWSISADQRTYTFHLRPGVRFPDGREVDAEDYAAEIRRVLDPRTTSPGLDYFRGILGARDFSEGRTNHVRGLRVPDPGTLEIELGAPDFTFRYVMAMPFAAAVPRDRIERDPEGFARRPTGSGPYQIAEWRRELSYRIERNPHFQGANTAFVDGIDVMIGGDRTLHAMMWENGDLDLVPDPTSADLIRLRRDPRTRDSVVFVPLAGTDYLAMNVELKPFDDPRVRRAINLAVDKDRLVRLAGEGFLRADSILPPTMPGYNASPPRIAHDPDKARALLREAGVPEGFQTEIWYVKTLPRWERIVASMQEDLHRVGIEVTLRPALAAAFETTVRTRRRVPMALWGWVQDYPDPSNFLDVLFSGARIREENCNNLAFYSRPEVTSLLAEAATLTDGAARLDRFRRAEDLILQDMPWVPVLYATQPFLVHPRVRGFRGHPVWLVRLEDLWLAPPPAARRPSKP